MRQLKKTKKITINKLGTETGRTDGRKENKSNTPELVVKKKKSTTKIPDLKVGMKVMSKIHKEECIIASIAYGFYSLETVARESWVGPHTLKEIEVIK